MVKTVESTEPEQINTLSPEELKDLIQSTNNFDDALLKQFQGNAENIEAKNIMAELHMQGIKFQDRLSEFQALVFRDMLDHLFLRIKLSHDSEYIRIYRLNPDRIRELSGN